MIVELLHDPVAPGFPGRNEPDLDTLGQTKTNQAAHPPWMGWAAVENQLVVDLLVPRKAQTRPGRPESVDRSLRSAVSHRLDSAPGRSQIDAVEAVETHGPLQVTRTDEIRLVNSPWMPSNQRRILLPFGLVRPHAPPSQFLTKKDAADRPHRRKGLDRESFHL